MSEPERRRNDELAEFNKRLNALEYSQGIIINKLDNMAANNALSTESLNRTMSRHDSTIFGTDGNSDSSLVNKISSVSRTLTDHILYDKWAYGIMITFLLLILGVLIKRSI